MEVGKVGFIQEAFRGFLRCLGLEGGGGGETTATAVNNPPPPLNPEESVTSEPLPVADDTPTIDPLASPIDSSSTAMTTTDVDDNVGGESNISVVTIDEIINMSGGTTAAEAHYVELLASGQANMNLLATSLISSGGGGKTH